MFKYTSGPFKKLRIYLTISAGKLSKCDSWFNDWEVLPSLLPCVGSVAWTLINRENSSLTSNKNPLIWPWNIIIFLFLTFKNVANKFYHNIFKILKVPYLCPTTIIFKIWRRRVLIRKIFLVVNFINF